MDHFDGAPGSAAPVLHGWSDQQVRGVLPTGSRQQPQCVVLRPEDREIGADLHLLQHPPLAFRNGRDRNTVLQRRRRHDPVGGHEGLRRDERRGAGQERCPAVLDTNGDGRITKPWHEPVGGFRSQNEGGGGGQLGTFDPKLDTRVNYGSYGVIVSPTDGSIWTSGTSFPGRFVRLERGDNPPQTCKAEFYEIPTSDTFGPRGIDVDRNGRCVVGAFWQWRPRQL